MTFTWAPLTQILDHLCKNQPSLHGAMNTNLLSGIMLFHNVPFKVMILRHPLILMALHILQMMIRVA